MDVRKPKLPPGRNRRLAEGEEERLLDQASKSRNPWLRPMIMLAIETAMRQGELLSLTWSDVHFRSKTIHLDMTKNGSSRTVPLSGRAMEVLMALPQDIRGRVFPTTQMAIIKSFTHACEAAGIDGLRFHDLRHEATSRFFERTDLWDMEIMSITGHKSPQMLARYAHLRGRNLVERLG
jgi:integrase